VPASPFPRYPFQHVEEIDTTRIAGLRLPAAAIGALAGLPFLVLELVNRREFGEGFPVALFVLLWMLPAGIVGMTRSMISQATIRRRRDGPQRQPRGSVRLALGRPFDRPDALLSRCAQLRLTSPAQ
jgi:hypothetical protein